MKIPCKLKYPGCEGFREIEFHGRINKSRIVKACRSCLKKRAVQYQQEYRERQKEMEKKAVRPRRPYRPRRTVSSEAKIVTGHVRFCRRCKEKIKGPNYRFCSSCHAIVSRGAGDTEEHSMPHVPVSGIN